MSHSWHTKLRIVSFKFWYAFSPDFCWISLPSCVSTKYHKVFLLQNKQLLSCLLKEMLLLKTKIKFFWTQWHLEGWKDYLPMSRMNTECIVLNKFLYVFCVEDYCYYSNKMCFDDLNIVCYKFSLGILLLQDYFLHFTELRGKELLPWAFEQSNLRQILSLLLSSFNASSKAKDKWSKLLK